MKKRIIALLMSICLAASLASCGENPWKDNSSTSTGGSSTLDSSQGQQENEDRVTEITLPISEEKLTFTEWRPWSNNYMSNYGEVQGIIELENRTNIHIDYTCVPAAACVEKFGLMLASGEYTDMIESDALVSGYPSGPDAAVADGVFRDMTDAVYQYMPNYYNLLKNNSEVKQIAITDEGRNVGIYMVRCWVDGANQEIVVETEPAWTGMAIRKDWLEELNMSVPRTVDQLHKVLVAFKENYGKGWLAMFTDGTIGCDYILSAYGITQDFYVNDGKIGFGPITDGYREYVTLMRDWFKEGLIDPNFVATESTWIRTANTYFANGECGVGVTYHSSVGKYYYMNGYTDNEKMELEPMMGPVLKEGDKTVTTYQSDIAMAPQWITTAVTDDELPVLAQWLDYHYTYDYTLIQSFGVEGVSYTIDENNPWYFVYTEAVTNPPVAGQTPGQARSMYALFNNVGFMNWKAGFQINELSGNTWTAHAYSVWGQQTDEIMLPASISFTAEEAQEYANIYTDIEAYVAENTVNFIVGNSDIDKEWDNFVANIEKMGVARCVELKQISYDRFASKIWALEGKD